MKKSRTCDTPLLTRRDAMRFLAVSAGWGVMSGLGGVDFAALLQSSASATKETFAKGAIIRTILKDLPPEAVGGSGAIMFHEHVSLTAAGLLKLGIGRPSATPQTPPSRMDPGEPYFMEDMKVMVDEVKTAIKDGLGCIVDAGHTDIGRSIQQLRGLAQTTGLQIVASGGYHTQPSYPPELTRQTDDQIADGLVRDARTERWGAFGEIGSAADMTPDERKVFRAVGKAHVKTNLPIFTHTAGGRPALEQLDIFESVGVKPQRVMIGHMGGTNDPTVPKAVCSRGAYIGFDQIARSYTQPQRLEAQVRMIVTLIDVGYADHVLLGTDLAFKNETKHSGGAGYGGVLTVFVPMLRQAGVKDEMLNRILVGNPRRLLAFVPMKSS